MGVHLITVFAKMLPPPNGGMKPTILREVMHRMLRRGLPLTAIASFLDVSRQTLWRWRCAGAAHASRPGTLTGDQQRMIADWVCDHPTATQSHAADWWRSLPVKSYTERNPLRVADWLSSMSHLPRGSVMALDEASFCLNHTQAYAYGRRGQRVVVPRPGRRGARYSLLVCADRRGVLRYVLHPGSITGRMFQDFLSALPAVQGRSLVMDNAVIHHSKRILPGVARLAEDRDLSLRYLPPYCPELNPVELVFNALRTHVRQRAPRCESQLRSAIDEGLRSLTPEATGRMFDRCLGCQRV